MEALIREGIAEFGFTASEEVIQKFVTFAKELKKWGSRINLTALLKDDQKMVEELFIDSLAPLKVIGSPGLEGKELFDIGSGGGFPGLPLKIISPDLKIILTDSIEKKVLFQRQVIRKLPLSGIKAIHTRFNENGTTGLKTNSFDFAVSKAVTDIETLGRWSYPHLKKGGSLICMKGPKEKEIEVEGYRSPDELKYKLPFSKIERYLFIYTKN